MLLPGTEAGLAENAIGYWLEAGQRSHDEALGERVVGDLRYGQEFVAIADGAGDISSISMVSI